MLAAAALALSACQESLEDRAAREAKEYTEKNCPVQINEAIVTDSMTFDKQTLTLHYYLSVKGPADTTAIANSEIKEDMIKALRGTTSVRPYKKHPGEKLFETTITKNDYKQ